MLPAAIYARSSRDRADVSIATQEHELRAIAQRRGLTVRGTFHDAVESGATEDRPGFQKLGDAIRDPHRGWSVLLVYDTSRIARRRYIAQAFKHLCRKNGVTIQYAKIPADIDPISELVLDAVFEAMDEVHSMLSRDKAVAGQRENVRRGWRAGGRAPIGYQLEQVATGAVREGHPVTKSRLLPSDQAAAISAYLKARARGIPRPTALISAGLKISKSSLVGIEWNALAYAGHTVWNRHPGRRSRGAGSPKRRARGEWEIQRDTHAALITDAEAEALLERLQGSELGAAISAGKRAASSALLSGLLMTSKGKYWRAAGKHYRLEGRPARNVKRETIEGLVMAQLETDLSRESFIEGMVKAAGSMQRSDDTLPARRKLAKLRRERDKAARLAVQEGGEAWVALVAEREAQIAAIEEEIELIGREAGLEEAVRALTPAAVRDLVRSIADPARLIQSLVERVVLDRTLVGRIEYRAALGPARGVSVASPPGSLGYATVPGAWFRVA